MDILALGIHLKTEQAYGFGQPCLCSPTLITVLVSTCKAAICNYGCALGKPEASGACTSNWPTLPVQPHVSHSACWLMRSTA
eukprot:scaffold32592_cov21-Tisochrysis_lutea.AAC.1